MATMPDTTHHAWLAPGVYHALRGRTVRIGGDDPVAASLREDAVAAGALIATDSDADVMLDLDEALGDGHRIRRADGHIEVTGGTAAALARGWFALVRIGTDAFSDDLAEIEEHPTYALRVLDHWDNVDVHPVMGQVERGYAGGSIFYDAGTAREDLSRARTYARLLAAIGIDRVAINNVNVGARESLLLTEDLGDVARIASEFRAWGVRVHLSVSFAAPIRVGGLDTADPLNERVRAWWADAAAAVWALIPDFGGFLVKADSEGQPGPFAYGRSHADGANMLAAAVAPFDGVVHWRAFVYNHRQDWRDRRTDRARASYDHFAPQDGEFAEHVVLQVKHGPMDFQTREPVSPVFSAMPRTRLALELQVTQEYTGHQRHVCYLAPWWSEILDFRLWGTQTAVSDVVAGTSPEAAPAIRHAHGGGITAVSNIGDDPFWTGHPLAQANLYAFGRLAWDSTLTASQILDEWIRLTFPSDDGEVDDQVVAAVHAIMDGSWQTYEQYTAPLGVGFMVTPGSHYGPSVDGYEYSPWGTYHFADRDGIGVDRSVATGTGFAGQYPEWHRHTYESVATCPDELLLFFHHVPYTHVLHSGRTVIQHIYDTHFAGADAVEAMVTMWESLRGRVDAALFDRVADRLHEQRRSSAEWRDQINAYFLRKSGIADERGRRIP